MGRDVREPSELSPRARKYFLHWIEDPLWDSRGYEMQNFYRFVKAVLKTKRRTNPPADSQVKELILRYRHSAGDDAARYYSSLYANLLEFDDTSFPDPLVDQSNVVACFNELRRQTSAWAAISTDMARVFGEDWLPDFIRRTGFDPSPKER